MKKYFILIVILSFFNFCCYSYYKISKEDIPYKKKDIAKIEYDIKDILYLNDQSYVDTYPVIACTLFIPTQQENPYNSPKLINSMS